MGHILAINDCGFGDAGKGTMVDAYAGRLGAQAVIRYNGGAQAVHHVMTTDGRSHGFSQFGSASFRPGVKTHLSRFMLMSPTRLLEEELALRTLGVTDAFQRLTIDRKAPIITPYHRAANWVRELARGAAEHGTCGMGIAETMQDLLANQPDMLFADDLGQARTVAVKLRRLRARKREELRSLIAQLSRFPSDRAELALKLLASDEAFVAFLRNCQRVADKVQIVDGKHLGMILAQDGDVVFEGAQGVLLDEWYGFHPYTTWSTTTFVNVDTLLDEQGFHGPISKIGVLRAYATRHGAGPFVTNDAALTHSLPEAHNRNDGWQGQFRVGWFDLVASRYALDVVGKVSGLAITNLDRIAHLDELSVCNAYRYTGDATPEQLAPFFSFRSDGCIERIKVNHTHDLERQEQLTRHLEHCAPEYISVARADYVSHLGRELGVPILATSYGPTAADKRFADTPILS